MFCENCGKSLIRGYNFCLECGTPVPPEHLEPVVDEPAQPVEDQGMPQIQPLSNDGGTLVFCSNCGMRMQSSTAYCEICGQQLQSNPSNGGAYSNLPKNGDVPLWNTERVDYGYETMSEGEIAQINNFMNGGGIADTSEYEGYSEIGADNAFVNAIGGADGSTMADIGNAAAEIDALTAQFANLVQPSGNEMPAIGTQEPVINDEIVKVENFAMDTSYVDDEYVDQGALPVIEGASMEYDPNEPEPEDPNTFEMTPEPIEAITPVYTPEEPACEEAEDDASAATEFAAAAGIVAATVADAVYDEPVAEEVPAYEEPAAEEVPAYEEPVAEEAPAYEEPVTEEAPAYEEPAAEDAAYAIPLYGADGDTATYAQEEEPQYSADIPLFAAPEEAVEEVPAYEEPAYESVETEDAPAEDAADAAAVAAAAVVGTEIAEDIAQAAEEPAAAYNSYSEPAYDNTYSTPEPAPAPVAEEPAEPAVDLGKLVYCRNCGQDMYENETVCKYCNAPKRPAYQPPRTRQGKAKEPFKLFGIFSIPSLVVLALVIVAVVAILLPSINKEDITDTSSKPSTTTTAAVSGNEQLNAGDVETEESSAPSTTTTASTTTTPVEEQPAETAEDVSAEANDTKEPDTTTGSSATSASTPDTSATTTPKEDTSATTTPKPVVTTTTSQGGAYTPSAAIKSQNKERDKMVAAYELMAEEVGKINLLASTTSYAIMFDSRDADIAGKSFYSRDFAAAVIKNIKGNKSSVAAAVAAAKPSTAELNTAYKALCALEDRYNSYLDYVVNATKFGSYESKCDTYLNSFTTYAASNFSVAAMNTSAQTAADKAEYYASVASEAVAAAENAAAAYNTLKTKVSALNEANFSGQFLNVMAENASTYMKAAKYTQAVASYCDILSSAPAEYANAYAGIKSARSNLNSLADLFALAQYDNTLANFKSSSGSYIASANSAAAQAKSAL